MTSPRGTEQVASARAVGFGPAWVLTCSAGYSPSQAPDLEWWVWQDAIVSDTQDSASPQNSHKEGAFQKQMLASQQTGHPP